MRASPWITSGEGAARGGLTQGLHFEHRSDDLAGRALWMFGNSDVDPPCWVLMAIMVSEKAQKMARCTIVCRDESDMEWALGRWKSVMRCDNPLQQKPGPTGGVH